MSNAVKPVYHRLLKMREGWLSSQWLGPLCVPILFLLTDYNGFFPFITAIFLYFVQYHSQCLSFYFSATPGTASAIVDVHPHASRKVSLRLSVTRDWKGYIPLNLVSKLWGIIAEAEIPYISSKLVTLYAFNFGCNLDEAEFPIQDYKTVASFFRRKLRPGTRPVDQNAEIISPADGFITFQGPYVQGYQGLLEQVKGIKYSLRYFLQEDYPQLLLRNASDTRLYQSVIYLSPKDYHRFHSPTDWIVTKRRHFPGLLLSVNPESFWVSKLHCNERVSYMGEWKHGFFSLTAVGATNVGSIQSVCDPDLITNRMNDDSKNLSYYEKKLHYKFEKGQEFGHFNFGSTIVLLFEAPKTHFDFREVTTISPVSVGQKL